MGPTIRKLLVALASTLLVSASLAHSSGTTTAASDAIPASPVIVIGFVGGFVRHDASIHSAVQVAEHLRKDHPSDLFTKVLENHHRGQAYTEIIRNLDTDHDGSLSAEEKRSARIILYGHSWGASEAVTLARDLGRNGIPVLLTVQVDSVSKPRENDAVIPANVSEAANFYQLNGLVHGRRQIRAADPAHTQIIGNFRLDYKANPIECKQYPWYDRIFMRTHIEIECDPKVWKQVESLIESKIKISSEHP